MLRRCSSLHQFLGERLAFHTSVLAVFSLFLSDDIANRLVNRVLQDVRRGSSSHICAHAACCYGNNIDVEWFQLRPQGITVGVKSSLASRIGAQKWHGEESCYATYIDDLTSLGSYEQRSELLHHCHDAEQIGFKYAPHERQVCIYSGRAIHLATDSRSKQRDESY